MHDISFDLETLSTRPDAAILSIGGVEFDIKTGETGREFYAVIDVNDAIAHGHVCGKTLMWWFSQSDDARAEIVANEGEMLAAALATLDVSFGWGPDTRVWGNGSTFDITIMENALLKCGYDNTPWKFWNVRDMRTIIDVAAATGFDKNAIPFEGTAHNALHDAKHQAKVISAAWNHATTPSGEIVD